MYIYIEKKIKPVYKKPVEIFSTKKGNEELANKKV